MSTENVEPWGKYRKLPLEIWYRPMDLSAETERMLDEAMVRLDVDKPDLAIHAALKKFLEDPEAAPPEKGCNSGELK
jgi:Ser/Thr protein kinase RdoA (MazF antagonist)